MRVYSPPRSYVAITDPLSRLPHRSPAAATWLVVGWKRSCGVERGEVGDGGGGGFAGHRVAAIVDGPRRGHDVSDGATMEWMGAFGGCSGAGWRWRIDSDADWAPAAENTSRGPRSPDLGSNGNAVVVVADDGGGGGVCWNVFGAL